MHQGDHSPIYFQHLLRWSIWRWWQVPFQSCHSRRLDRDASGPNGLRLPPRQRSSIAASISSRVARGCWSRHSHPR